jgi:hypothetical protein
MITKEVLINFQEFIDMLCEGPTFVLALLQIFLKGNLLMLSCINAQWLFILKGLHFKIST